MQELPLERLRLDNLGAYLHLAMKLERIPSEDIAAVAALVNHSYTRSSVYVLVFWTRKLVQLRKRVFEV
jgi:hypothetical protein